MSVETTEIPCRFIVAEYVNGENQLPILRPAIDAEQAAIIASHRAKDKLRPIVKVFTFDEMGVCQPMMTVRGPADAPDDPLPLAVAAAVVKARPMKPPSPRRPSAPAAMRSAR